MLPDRSPNILAEEALRELLTAAGLNVSDDESLGSTPKVSAYWETGTEAGKLVLQVSLSGAPYTELSQMFWSAWRAAAKDKRFVPQPDTIDNKPDKLPGRGSPKSVIRFSCLTDVAHLDSDVG